MAIQLHHERGNTYRLDITGTMLRAEFARCEAELRAEVERVGTLRLLCVLCGFEGWETQVDWSNLTFYIQHGDAIERIAIVGDEKWKALSMMFAGADLRRAPVEFFPERDLAKARTWLSA